MLRVHASNVYPTYLCGLDPFSVTQDVGSLWKESCILPMHQALQLSMSSDVGYLLMVQSNNPHLLSAVHEKDELHGWLYHGMVQGDWN